MKTYKVEVFESLARVVEIEANSPEEATEKVKKLYEKEEIVLDYSDFGNVEFNII
jgi:hypothetical protein